MSGIRIATIKKHRLVITALVLILLVSIFLQIQQRELWALSYFVADDVDYINIANNVKSGSGFVVSYQNNWQGEYRDPLPGNVTASAISKLYPELNTPYGGKGPIHFLLLAFTYWVTGATITNWYFWGSVLSGIITLCMIITLFIFSKKYFGVDIAIVSAFIASIATMIVLYSTRILQYPLVYTFIIMSFLFIKKTKRDCVLFGIFAGLANLTHPIGILPIAGYGLFLLFKKEFKEFGIVVLTWFLVLLPWFIRNVLTFGGFGYGLGIPYSTTLSELLGLDRFASSHFIPGILGQSLGFASEFLPFDTFSQFYSLYLTTIYHAQTLTLILLFIIAAFISFEGIKKYLNVIYSKPRPPKLLFGIKIIAIFIFVVFLLTSNLWAKYITDNPIQIILFTQVFLIFILPIVLLVKLYKSNREIFEISIPRIHLVIPFFGLVSLLVYIFFSQEQNIEVLELKVLMPFFLIGLPLGLYGIKKISVYLSTVQLHGRFQNYSKFLCVRFVTSKFIKKYANIPTFTKIPKYNKIFFLIIVVLAASSLLELKDGYTYWLLQARYSHPIEKSMADMNGWINANIADKSAVVASDLMPTTWQTTGLRSVILPTGELNTYNVNNLENFIQKYNVTYIIMYYNYNTWILDNYLGNKYYFEKVYQSGTVDHVSSRWGRDYQVYKINNLFDTNVNDSSLYAERAIVLKNSGQQKEADKIYGSLLTSGKIGKIDLLTQLRLYTAFGQMNESINVVNEMIGHDQSQGVLNLISSYINSGQTKKTDQMAEIINSMLERNPYDFPALSIELFFYQQTGSGNWSPTSVWYDHFLKSFPDNEELRKRWGDLINTLIKQNDRYWNGVLPLLDNATKLEQQGDFQQALVILKKLQYVDQFTADSYTGQIRILTNLKQYDDVLTISDQAISKYEEMFSYTSKLHSERDKVEKALNYTLYNKAQLLTNLQRYDDADNTYLEIIRLNQFDIKAHEKRAMILGILGEPDEAARELDFVKRLELIQK